MIPSRTLIAHSARHLLVLMVCLATTRTAVADANLSIPDMELTSGRLGTIPILLDNEEPVYAVQLSLTCDSNVLRIRSVEVTLGVADGAEFSDGVATEDGGALSWGIVLDISAPFDPNSFIPPGEGRLLAELVVEVPRLVENMTTTVRFEDNPENAATPSSINKVVREEGIPLPLNTFDGEVTALASDAGPLFLRGDANNDLGYDLSDGVFLLNFLFTAGLEPECLDAADSNDNGVLDLSDAVYSFNNLFTGGPPPAPPHPAVGEDPTADELSCLNPAAN